ncbi:MAG: hypothetical protein B7Z47_05255, partial [Chthoniobacter sp. 12-60-6]
ESGFEFMGRMDGGEAWNVAERGWPTAGSCDASLLPVERSARALNKDGAIQWCVISLISLRFSVWM